MQGIEHGCNRSLAPSAARFASIIALTNATRLVRIEISVMSRRQLVKSCRRKWARRPAWGDERRGR
jgi:hypothetical protein